MSGPKCIQLLEEEKQVADSTEIKKESQAFQVSTCSNSN